MKSQIKEITVLDKEYRSESQSVDRLDEQRTKPPRLEHPSILRLVRQRLSATNRLNSSLNVKDGPSINTVFHNQRIHSSLELQ